MVSMTAGHASGPTMRITPASRDFAVFTLWATVTFVQFPGDELLLYPLALYYAYTIWRDQDRILPLMARGWIILIFPVWCLISPLWAVAPFDSLKHALYLMLTMVICVQVAATLGPRQIMHAIFTASSLIAAVHVLVAYGIGDNDLGIFPSKNTMGKNMVILWAVAFAVFLDRGSNRLLRLTGLGVAGVACGLAVVSNSATAVLLVLGSGVLLAVGAVVLAGGLFRASRMAAVAALLAAVLLSALAVLPFQQVDPFEAVLSHFGKDSTLTGRTLLWQYAEDQIRERPLLGVGAGGYWRYQDSPLIQRIFYEFHKGPWDVFNFHNSYYKVAVHQGLIGLVLMLIPTVWGVFVISRWALGEGSIPAVYMLAHMTIVLARTSTEADFLKPFVLFHMIFWIGALTAIRRRIAPISSG